MRTIATTLVLEGELGVRHANASRKVFVDLTGEYNNQVISTFSLSKNTIETHYHNVLAGQGEIGQLFLQRMEEGHASSHVQGEANGLCSVDHQTCALMENGVERSVDHVLVDDD